MKLNIIRLFACGILLGCSAQAGVVQQSVVRQADSTVKHFAALVNSNRCEAAYALISSEAPVDKEAELAQLKDFRRRFGQLTIGQPAYQRGSVPYAVLDFGSGCLGPNMEYSLEAHFRKGHTGLIEGEFEVQEDHLVLRKVSVKVPWTDQKDRQAFVAISIEHPKQSK